MKKKITAVLIIMIMMMGILFSNAFAAPSAEQITEAGGSVISDDGKVEISKTIEKTDIENVFDITLNIKTSQDIKETLIPDDVAVVIVMDISNTMVTATLPSGDTRYTATMKAAEDFIRHFEEHAILKGIKNRKVGFVAFNTSAHEIFPMTVCQGENDIDTLVAKMKSGTEDIIYADGYNASHERFTNIEAGLKMGGDVLSSTGYKHKYMILLSDGMPTTYVKSGYTGYDPYMSVYTGDRTPGTDGYFYDSKTQNECTHGTSYSDKGAKRAKAQADSLKNAGTTIYTIGAALQETDDINDYTREGSFSVVDYFGTDAYAIGAGGTTADFKNWLKNSVGSGYYYDCYDTSGLKGSFEEILSELEAEADRVITSSWITKDPIPEQISPGGEFVEFIHLYDKNGNAVSSLSGENKEGAENTASFKEDEITWDVKKSGYEKSGDSFIYTLKYRVRLKNEAAGFIEKQNDTAVTYATNGEAFLKYRIADNHNGNVSVSDPKQLFYPIPSVKGYLSELCFDKQNDAGEALSGAEFTLSHADTCSVCKGNNTPVAIDDMKAFSGEDGKVLFEGIPSGHDYILSETAAPFGHYKTNDDIKVKVAYDEISIYVNGEKTDALTVVNEKAQDPEVSFEVSKTISGDTPHMPNAFSFELMLISAVSPDGSSIVSAPMPGGESVYAFDITGANTAFIPAVSFDKAGTYVYEIKETAADSAAYTNDASFYKIVVEVLEENGIRTADKKIFKGEDEVSEVVFDNVYTLNKNDVYISKTVEDCDEDDRFLFEAYLYDRLTGEALSGVFEFERESFSINTQGSITFTDGKASFYLEGGDTVIIKGLDAGTRFTVTESPDENYKTQVNGEDANGISGMIKEDDDTYIDFVNTYIWDETDPDENTGDKDPEDKDEGGKDEDKPSGGDGKDDKGDSGKDDKKDTETEDIRKTGDEINLAIFEFVIVCAAVTIFITAIIFNSKPKERTEKGVFRHAHSHKKRR